MEKTSLGDSILPSLIFLTKKEKDNVNIEVIGDEGFCRKIKNTFNS
jgi:hypothetical protein